jgi:hypothetical protein
MMGPQFLGSSLTIALPFPLICFFSFGLGLVSVDEEGAQTPFYAEGAYNGKMNKDNNWCQYGLQDNHLTQQSAFGIRVLDLPSALVMRHAVICMVILPSPSGISVYFLIIAAALTIT